MIGHVITFQDKTKWVIFDTWGDFDEYFCITDFETQSINELILKTDASIVTIEDYKVEWLFLARRARNLKDFEEMIK